MNERLNRTIRPFLFKDLFDFYDYCGTPKKQLTSL